MTRLLPLAAAWLLSSSALAQTYAVVLTEPGPNKIQLIKQVRAATALGLKEAKDLVEAPMPQLVKDGITLDDATRIATSIRDVGGKVEVRSEDGKLAQSPPSGATPTRANGSPLLTPTTAVYAVQLDSFGTSKIGCIKVARDATGLGLAETKTMVESAPTVVKKNLTRQAADTLVKQFSEAGGRASVLELKDGK